ncbi:hypothetical protein EJ04DRAFT_579234 [Polyplosphaeria fusca]|uniref:N-acetyltransferase domain-containing protein n=1 Tax=Polyplosphaeria fusca TaxID=682080 RepID=A0A9P4QRQ4_9PLEO|nr:hypothetical protein EJ04DRAFT_579234 [Polyplosphaeria fusca]
MPLVLSVVKSASEFEKIIPMNYDGWQSPYNPQLKHFWPNLASREEYIAFNIKRHTKEFEERDPNKKWWIIVTDTDTNEIIGEAIWEMNEMKGEIEPTKATWKSEGSDDQKFAETFISGLWEFLGQRVTRPHMDLDSLVVAQAHRKRGAGRMLVRWGIEKADELGIETVVSSLPSARGAYEKAGLGYIEVIPPTDKLNVENPSDRWKELLDDDLSGFLMWRPIGHDYVEGVDRAPWI